MSIKITGLQLAQDALRKELEKLQGGGYVLVGIHEDAGMIPDGDISMAHLGAVQHFGATIQHPGGTKYDYDNKGNVRFLSSSSEHYFDVTKAHQITIPPRPWLDVGVESGNKEYLEIISEGVADGIDSEEILDRVGAAAEGAVKQYIRDLKSPPNAASTIRKKGSANPLIGESGAMMGSVKYVVVKQKPEEGL